MARSLLLIDDDPAVLGLLERAFRRAGYSVVAAPTGDAGIEKYARDATDLVILDLNLPDTLGLDVLSQLREVNPDVAVIVLTGQADLPTAVEAMRAGAENFLPKPVEVEHLYAAAERAYEKVELRHRAGYLESRQRDETSREQAPDQPSAMRELEEKMALLAPTDTTVLLLGETGTGKSWAARRIHALSRRSRGPFVELNAAALTTTFLESELFGHERGAFTDAKTMKRGLFEVADGGTLLLDEIGDLAPQLQPKLLHVIETGGFRRIGGTRDIESNARLIAATNRDLEQAVAAGDFREDLYYRLAVMPLTLPPLRDRGPEAFAALVQDVLDQLQQQGSGRRKSVAGDALDHLARYPWPGNIRELRNVLERAVILAAGTTQITPDHLPAEVVRNAPDPSHAVAGEEVRLTLEEVERRHIRRVLEHCEDNRSRAARMLGISRVGLYKKLKRMEGDTETA